MRHIGAVTATTPHRLHGLRGGKDGPKAAVLTPTAMLGSRDSPVLSATELASFRVADYRPCTRLQLPILRPCSAFSVRPVRRMIGQIGRPSIGPPSIEPAQVACRMTVGR